MTMCMLVDLGSNKKIIRMLLYVRGGGGRAHVWGEGASI
jgi:hypothetical protein